MSGEDNGVIPVRGYAINRNTGFLLGLITSLLCYLVLIRVDSQGPSINTAHHPLAFGLPGVASCAMCALPFIVIALYGTCMAFGPKGTKAAIS